MPLVTEVITTKALKANMKKCNNSERRLYRLYKIKSKPLVSDLNANVRTPAQQLSLRTKSSALSAYRNEINFLNPMILGCLVYPMIKNYAIVTICATMSGVSMIVGASEGRKKGKEEVKNPQLFDCSFGGKFTLQILSGSFEISGDS